MSTSNRMGEVNSIGIIGYGEVGQFFTTQFLQSATDVLVTSRSLHPNDSELEESNVTVIKNPELLVEACDIALSCVWPETANTVIENIPTSKFRDSTIIDFNSISPETTKVIESRVRSGGGNLVKGSIMGSMSRHGSQTPLIIAGKENQNVEKFLTTFGFNVTNFGTDPASSAAIKMARSIITKGLLAIFVEGLLTAKEYDVEEEVIRSLDNTFGEMQFGTLSQNFLENHRADRRKGEMEEAMSMINNIGLDGPITFQTLFLLEVLSKQNNAVDYQSVLENLRPHYSNS